MRVAGAAAAVALAACACAPRATSPRDILLDPTHPEWSRPAPPVSYARFETSNGDFAVELVREWAPRGVDRFYNLVRLGYYDDTRFHRVSAGYIAQFGLHGDPAVTAAWRGHELPDDPPRSDNRRGTFAFAQKGPDTRLTQVYINLGDNRRNDVEPFSMLGTVIAGMDVLDSLYAGYGENSGSGMRQGRQGPIESGGNAYLDREFPLLDRIIRARILGTDPRRERERESAEGFLSRGGAERRGGAETDRGSRGCGVCRGDPGRPPERLPFPSEARMIGINVTADRLFDVLRGSCSPAAASAAAAAAALSVLALMPSSLLAQDRPVEEYIAAIEGAQASPGPNGLGSLTIAELMKRFNVPGVSIAVIRDFEIHWAKGYGIADVETGAPVDTATLFQAASISKPVAAMGVLRAVQDGLFGLDDDINDILRSWKLAGGEFTAQRAVTPRMLTSHTSGLGDAFGFPGYDPAAPLPTIVQILEGQEPSNVGRVFMERPPMSLMEYSGGGVTLMQLALSDARARPFAEIMRHDVLLPIGMSNSTFEQPIPPARDRNAARAHDREGRSRGAKWHIYPEMAAAGLWTTPSDLARFLIEVQNSALGRSNRVLSRATVQEMLTPVGVGDFAVGFTISKIGQGWYFSHGGSNWGFRATIMGHKVKGYGLAIMTNADQGGAVAAELTRRIQTVYDWDAVAEPAPRGYAPPVERREVDVAEAILRTYVGTYQLSPERSVEITLENARLHAQPTGQAKLPLFAESDTMFFLRGVNAQISFTKDAAGAVTGLVLHQGGQRQTGRRVR